MCRGGSRLPAPAAPQRYPARKLLQRVSECLEELRLDQRLFGKLLADRPTRRVEHIRLHGLEANVREVDTIENLPQLFLLPNGCGSNDAITQTRPHQLRDDTSELLALEVCNEFQLLRPHRLLGAGSFGLVGALSGEPTLGAGIQQTIRCADKADD